MHIIDAYTIPGTERETEYPPERLLADMDAAGIAQAVVAPEDREMIIANAGGNRRLLALARASDGRLIPACSVNPWRGEEGLRLLREAAAEGARLLVLSGALQGFLPVDEVAAPLLDLAGELKMPVYFHTGPHSFGVPTQVVLAAQGHPGTRFILGHCGSTDLVYDMAAILNYHLLPNLWYDLSHLRPWSAGHLVTEANADRFIWGSGAPRQAIGFELEHFQRNLPPDRFPGVYGANVLSLLEGVAVC